MAATSLEAVKRKIRFLQEQADGAEEKAEKLQMQLLVEKKAREQVSIFFLKKKQRVQPDRSCHCKTFLL